MGIESLKIFLLEDNLLKRLSTDKGNCLMMKEGGSTVYVYSLFHSLFY